MKQKLLALILIISMLMGISSISYATPFNMDSLNLQNNGYMSEDGYHETGSYVLKSITYEYVQHTTNDGKIYLDVYQISNARSANNKIKTQEICADLNANIMFVNGETLNLVTNDCNTSSDNGIATYGEIYNAVFTGNTLAIDIARYSAETLAVQLISWSFGGVIGVGVSLVLSIAVSILEGYSGTFYADYKRFVTTELFPLEYPGYSAVNKISCQYFNHSTGTAVGKTREYIELVF